MRGTAALLLAISGPGLAGCAPPARIQYERRLEETPDPARHAVHSARLEQLMRGLERLEVERLPQALDLREEHQRRSEEVVAVALAMADSAERIQAVAPTLDLDDEGRTAFLELASQLGERADQLARTAPHLPPEALRAQAHSIEETCSSCHGRFRIDRGHGSLR